MQLEAVIFDLDDTLYAERDYVDSGLAAVASWLEPVVTMPAETIRCEMVAMFESGVRGNLFDEWFTQHHLHSDGHVGRMVEIYRSHEPDIRPFDGVERLLMSLAKSCRIGILTDGYLIAQEKKVAALGLRRLVDEVVFTDAFGPEAWKPAPVAFGLIAEALHVHPERSVYVADNPAKDFLGARRAGMGSIRVRLTGGMHEHAEPETPEHAPTTEIASLDALEYTLSTLRSSTAT